MITPSEINEVRVIYDDTDPDNAGWFARAYNDTYPLPDIQLEAEDEANAVAEARKELKWSGSVKVYPNIGLESWHTVPAE